MFVKGDGGRGGGGVGAGDRSGERCFADFSRTPFELLFPTLFLPFSFSFYRVLAAPIYFLRTNKTRSFFDDYFSRPYLILLGSFLALPVGSPARATRVNSTWYSSYSFGADAAAGFLNREIVWRNPPSDGTIIKAEPGIFARRRREAPEQIPTKYGFRIFLRYGYSVYRINRFEARSCVLFPRDRAPDG